MICLYFFFFKKKKKKKRKNLHTYIHTCIFYMYHIYRIIIVENLFDLIIILNNLELIKKKYIFLYHGRNYEKKNKFIKKNNIFFLYNYTYCVDFNNKYSGINNNIVV
ncbi:hypothetical protein PFFVO_00628 [Plasmodium falciparum Vietnam Oak-Knoll (FVO)]|uniref:Uncharacterized protein n=1 Tax=Plasmodium falciparum Vietnam Oak-Knoll (FVO) TaxID=1036723 RepID=A0A024VBM5_PLAFA|nr:hypothetical protein PFFVO_00628 [Plasmodium falciparum Vietnam Oak-Knoll (FVO)]